MCNVISLCTRQSGFRYHTMLASWSSPLYCQILRLGIFLDFVFYKLFSCILKHRSFIHVFKRYLKSYYAHLFKTVMYLWDALEKYHFCCKSNQKVYCYVFVRSHTNCKINGVFFLRCLSFLDQLMSCIYVDNRVVR